MKFKAILEEKKLKVDELPKTLQKKISEFGAVMLKLDELELDEDDKKEVEKKLNLLDRHIEASLLKFNPEVYKKRLSHIHKIRPKKDEKEEEQKEIKEEAKEIEKVEPKEEVVEVEVVEEKVIEQPKEVVEQPKDEWNGSQYLSNVEDDEEYQEYICDECREKLDEDINNLKSKLRQEPIEVEVEDLAKEDNAMPKKMSKGLILMGVGAFLLTWGAVNFFKERR